MNQNKQSHLESIGNRNPFSVPDNYFENFALAMDGHIASKQVSAKRIIMPWMYLAAMFVGVFILGNIFFNIYQSNQRDSAELYEMYVTSQLNVSAHTEYYWNSDLSNDE